MVDMQDLESILNARTVPAPRSNLEERIIAMAFKTPQVKKSSVFGGMFSGFWEGFLLPAPVLSMVFVVCLGGYVGMNTQPVPVTKTAEVADAEIVEYFEIAYNADYGDRI